ncbi:MAG: NAD(P)/FAD-dependent oxidoreductase, partial [Bacteroidota bacterium]
SKLRQVNWGSNFYSEYKFKSSTWFGFFEKYMIPQIGDKISYNSPVSEINYQGDKVEVKNTNGESYEADKVLITVPIKMLQKETIQFLPALPQEKTAAINKVFIGDGIKVFIEFEERFYPDITLQGGMIEALTSADWTYYDAAFRKDSERNILGLFTVGEKSSPYAQLNTEEEIINKILAELDEMYEGQASINYKKHIIQNWSKEPYIGGSYALDYENRSQTIDTILEPVESKVYFAGEAIHKEWQSTVNGACESGYEVVKQILGV